jgi:hypothetical protein
MQLCCLVHCCKLATYVRAVDCKLAEARMAFGFILNSVFNAWKNNYTIDVTDLSSY